MTLSEVKALMLNIKKLLIARKLFSEQLIVLLVSRFDEFLAPIIAAIFKNNQAWLRSTDKSLTYKDLLELGTFDSAFDAIVAKEVDILMHDSHVIQLKFLDEKLKLGLFEHFEEINCFLEVAERRNLFVHSGGKTTKQYIANCKSLGISIDSELKEGTYLPAADKYFRDALRWTFELGLRIGQSTIRRLFPDALEYADQRLNELGIRLLESEDWELGELVFCYGECLPTNLRSSGEMYYYFVINRCIALKQCGKNFSEVLKPIDWEAFHPKYHLAIAVLKEGLSKAEKLMTSAAVLEEVSEEDFRTWPLFRDFRKTDEFKRAYKVNFKKDYVLDYKKDVEDQPSGSDQDTKL